MEFVHKECQWVGPEQDPRKGVLEYCCKPVFPGRSYCEDHVWKVYQKGTGLNNKRKIKELEREIAYRTRFETEINDDEHL